MIMYACVASTAQMPISTILCCLRAILRSTKKELAAKDYWGRAVADGFWARELGISLYCQGWTGQKM